MARSHSHRHAHRRRKHGSSTARIGIAGGVTGVAGVVAAATLLVFVHAHGDPGESAPGTVAVQRNASRIQGSAHGEPTAAARLKTGDRLDVSTPEGFSYSLAGVEAGTSGRPLASTRTTPPPGTTFAYVDYVITNTGTAPALLDFPADLFVRRSLVPAPAQSNCVSQPGAPADLCTLPDRTEVVNTLGYAPPTTQDEDQYIPAGAGYLVRVAADVPVSATATRRDLGLYVWNPRFAPGRKALAVPLPAT